MKITWNGDWSSDGRFMVQTEHVNGEPVHYSLVCREPTRYQDEEIIRRAKIETGFYGRGGKGKVKQAAQQAEDARCAALKPPDLSSGWVASAYKVWQVDCPCGEVMTYGEDDHPEKCERCGAPVEESM